MEWGSADRAGTTNRSDRKPGGQWLGQVNDLRNPRLWSLLPEARWGLT